MQLWSKCAEGGRPADRRSGAVGRERQGTGISRRPAPNAGERHRPVFPDLPRAQVRDAESAGAGFQRCGELGVPGAGGLRGGVLASAGLDPAWTFQRLLIGLDCCNRFSEGNWYSVPAIQCPRNPKRPTMDLYQVQRDRLGNFRSQLTD